VVLALPVNLLLMEVENLFFLWFPAPLMPANALDFQTAGRQTILILLKTGCVGLVLAIATAIGAAGFFLSRGSWSVTIGIAGIVILGLDIAFLPLLCQAFTHFDVARERPE
jgi:hypothetical protein